MMADPLPTPPASFKPVQHYLKTAVEHDKRDPVVSYYCRLYALQKAMEIDRQSPECRNFLKLLMNHLEQTKKQQKDVEAVQNEVVGQAHMENYAIKLFYYADTEDRAGRFGKNVVKSFYTAGMLMDVLSNFGEVPEDVEKNRKYAKWKAAYIHNCLKNGETPLSGPQGDEMGEFGEEEGAGPAGVNPMQTDMNHYQQPVMPSPSGYANQPQGQFPQPPSSNAGYLPPAPHQIPPANYPPSQPHGFNINSAPQNPVAAPRVAPVAGGNVALKPEDYTKAMKLCKYASSALQYEDSKTAIENLNKALNLLTMGHE